MTSRTVRDPVREGELVRAGIKVEIESNLNDPLAALQTFVRMALPTHPQLRSRNTLGAWTRKPFGIGPGSTRLCCRPTVYNSGTGLAGMTWPGPSP
jgi:hypothetical protein